MAIPVHEHPRPALGRPQWTLLGVCVLLAGVGAWLIHRDFSNAPIHKTWHALGPSAEEGGISRTRGHSLQPAIALDPTGHPVAAWSQYSLWGQGIYLRRWTGTAWEQLGTRSASRFGLTGWARCTDPVIACDSEGRVMVAWISFEQSLGAIRWNGQDWEELGHGSSEGVGISDQRARHIADLDLVLGHDSEPILAWVDDSSGNSEVHLRCWDGGAWEELGGSASGGGVSNHSGDPQDAISPAGEGPQSVREVDLALSPGGFPVVAWSATTTVNSDNGQEEWSVLHAAQWTGAEWRRLDTIAPPTWDLIASQPHHNSRPHIAVDSEGHILMAWVNHSRGVDTLRIMAWDGAHWIPLEGMERPVWGITQEERHRLGRPRLVLDAEDRPIVAWTVGPQAHIKRWDGSEWVEIGEGSARRWGISGERGGSRDIECDLAIDDQGHLFAVWEHLRDNRPRQIHLRTTRPPEMAHRPGNS